MIHTPIQENCPYANITTVANHDRRGCARSRRHGRRHSRRVSGDDQHIRHAQHIRIEHDHDATDKYVVEIGGENTVPEHGKRERKWEIRLGLLRSERGHGLIVIGPAR